MMMKRGHCTDCGGPFVESLIQCLGSKKFVHANCAEVEGHSDISLCDSNK
jgi:hypothetical protein